MCRLIGRHNLNGVQCGAAHRTSLVRRAVAITVGRRAGASFKLQFTSPPFYTSAITHKITAGSNKACRSNISLSCHEGIASAFKTEYTSQGLACYSLCTADNCAVYVSASAYIKGYPRLLTSCKGNTVGTLKL